MGKRHSDKKEMPDVPKLDFRDALAEVWFQVNYAAYHMAYVRVYSSSTALRTKMPLLRAQIQDFRNDGQVDMMICRTHLAAFFWHLEHIFEALRIAIKKGKEEYAEGTYFDDYKKRLDDLETLTIRREIKDYRNMAHQVCGIIGCNWKSDGILLHHFLPTISGHQPQENIDMNTRLQQYFEFAANIWIEFTPGGFEHEFPRDFRFPVTVPYFFEGELPPGLAKSPQFEVLIQSTGEHH